MARDLRDGVMNASLQRDPKRHRADERGLVIAIYRQEELLLAGAQTGTH